MFENNPRMQHIVRLGLLGKKISHTHKSVFSVFICEIAYLTLTFDLVTLSLGQLQHLINIKPMYDFDQDPIICS